MLIRDHHINFVAHLAEAGLLDLQTGLVHPELLAYVQGLADVAINPSRLHGGAMNQVQLAVLRELTIHVRNAKRFDGRVLKALANRGLVERYMEPDPEVVKQAYERPNLLVEEPVGLYRITEAGRAMLAGSDNNTPRG